MLVNINKHHQSDKFNNNLNHNFYEYISHVSYKVISI